MSCLSTSRTLAVQVFPTALIQFLCVELVPVYVTWRAMKAIAAMGVSARFNH